MNIDQMLNNLFSNLKNRNKWDSWTFIFKLLDGGHCKIIDIYGIGEIHEYDKSLIDIRRKQYLETMTAQQKRKKKTLANRRLKTELKKFIAM